MKRKSSEDWLSARSRQRGDVPLLTPMEAAMTPAARKQTYGALRQARRKFDFDDPQRISRDRQRQKIWVR